MNKKVTFLVLSLNVLTHIDCKAMETKENDEEFGSELKASPGMNLESIIVKIRSKMNQNKEVTPSPNVNWQERDDVTTSLVHNEKEAVTLQPQNEPGELTIKSEEALDIVSIEDLNLDDLEIEKQLSEVKKLSIDRDSMTKELEKYKKTKKMKNKDIN
jgi:hypothetical protein